MPAVFPMREIDPSLYLVINPEQCRHQSPVEIARNAVAGGVSTVQIRTKVMSDQSYTELAAQVNQALRPLHVPVFVNDRLEVAAAAGINCIHLGQDDVSVQEARHTLGPDALIGLTVRSMEEAESAPTQELSYLSVGGVFATQSKANPDPPIGLTTLKHIVRHFRSRGASCPIIAISGINQTNLESVLSTEVDGVAVVSAICESDNPEAAARELRSTIHSYQTTGN